MAAETHHRYATSEDELFDSGAVVHSRHDMRSVGEMLRDADYLSRQLLMDVTGGDAAPLIHSWPTLVDAAAALWAALPRRSWSGDDPDLPMQRLVATTRTFREPLRRNNSWPSPGPTHAGIDHIAETLRKATNLIDRFGGDVRPELPGVDRDLAAARARTMHTLYLVAHALTVALNAHGRDLVGDSRASGRPIALSTTHTAYAVRPVGAWLQRAARCESIPRRYLGTGFAAAAQGEAVMPHTDTDRIPRALAGWDIWAHRTLASDASPANLALIAHTQSYIAATALTLLDATTPPPALADPIRLRSAIAATGAAWGNLAARWTDLTRPSDQIHAALASTAAELRAAYRQSNHEPTNSAISEATGIALPLVRAVSATIRGFDAGADLAVAMQEQAKVEDLTGPARALSRRAHNDVDAGLATDPDGDTVWVSPADIHRSRSVLLPPPVAEGLRAASQRVVTTAESAAATAAVTYQQSAMQSRNSMITRVPAQGRPSPRSGPSVRNR